MTRRLPRALAAASFLIAGGACTGAADSDTDSAAPTFQAYTIEVLNTYPHDNRAFTQGLIFYEDSLFESTGRYGQSTVRRVDLQTGDIDARIALPARFFGEGLTLHEGELYSVTWQAGAGFKFDPETLRRTGQFEYAGEGWGLTSDGTELILSDGSDTLRFLDPATFETVRSQRVTLNGRPIDQLNELEWIDGQIYANVWRTSRIVIIAPSTGRVVGEIDASALTELVTVRQPEDDVLNGIAWDEETERLFLTGKNWPSLFEVRLVPASDAP